MDDRAIHRLWPSSWRYPGQAHEVVRIASMVDAVCVRERTIDIAQYVQTGTAYTEPAGGINTKADR